MQANAVLNNSDTNTPDSSVMLVYSGLIAVASYLLAGLVITGWIALGERANISRRELNSLEWVVIVLGVLLGLAATRTLYGFLMNEEAALPWAQWVAFGTMAVSFIIGLYAITGETNASQREFSLGALIISVLFLVVSVITYRYLSLYSESSPHQYIGIQLAESPSAGAIIGFLFILLFFSMSSDLFLTSRSAASVLTNSATKGIIAIGVTMLMISGEFDLSVGSILGVSAMLFMLLMTRGLDVLGQTWIGVQPVGTAALITLGFACLLGLINGVLLIRTQIPSFIVTLGTLFAYRAITLVVIAGGRILRYRDYYSEFPIVYMDRWLLVVGPILAALFVGLIAYSSVRNNLRRAANLWTGNIKKDAHVRKFSYDITPFKTTLAMATVVWTVIMLLVYVGFLTWLLAVAALHAEEIKGVTGLVLILGTFVFGGAAIYAYGWLGREWYQFVHKRNTMMARSMLEMSDDERAAAHMAVAERKLIDLEGIARKLASPYIRFGNLMGDLVSYQRNVLIALGICLGSVIGFAVIVNQLFVERTGSYVIGAFTIFNGRWQFTGENVSRGLLNIEIPQTANFTNSIVWWFLFILLFQTILTRTAYGNATYAVGGNKGAARAQGINVNRVKVQNFVLVAFLTGIAAILEVARNPGVDPLKGNTWELEVIAMTVVGGTLLTGGYGSIFGTLLGTIIFGMLGTGLVLIGVDSRLLQGVIGVTLIVAVVLNNASKRNRS